jgi:GxxExxY protein
MNREDAKTRSFDLAKKEELNPIDLEEEKLASVIVDSAYTVHKAMGSGLLENIYEACLSEELEYRGLSIRRQYPIPVTYRNKVMEAGFRADLIVENRILVELKAVEKIIPVHRAQTLSYLRLTGLRLGFLINFNVPLIKEGIVRIIDRKKNFAPSGLRDSIQKE